MTHLKGRFLVLALAAAGLALGADDKDSELRPTGKDEQKWLKKEAKPNGVGPSDDISYHGGPVMLNTVHAYVIWYGAWDDASKLILTDLFNKIGNSPYFNINQTYYSLAGTTKNFVSGAVTLAGQTDDAYSLGTTLSDAGVQTVVANAISSNNLPKDLNGVYFVLTSANVKESSGFCTQYCGWHTYGTIAGSNIKYSFVGNPAACPSACTNGTPPPNGNVGVDGMASIIAHELAEAVTDPNLNAWYDRRGQENADKCAWTFGTLKTDANGGVYNVTLGSRNYLLQRNWRADTQNCALQ